MKSVLGDPIVTPDLVLLLDDLGPPEQNLRSPVSFLRRASTSLIRSRWPVLAIMFLVLLVLVALFAPQLAPANPDRQNLILRLKPPLFVAGVGQESFVYVLGSDGLGRDVLSRLVYGARVSLTVGVAAVSLGGLLGTFLGVLGGFFGGRIDSIIMAVANIQLAFPFILLAIMTLVVLKAGLGNLVVVLAIGQWVTYARIARGETISQKRKDYVEGKRAVGVNTLRIIIRGIVPNILSPLVVVASFNVAAVILSEASLSFLGLGVPPTVPTWGSMLADSRDQILGGFWWLAVYPGLAIMATVLSLNILGDWIRDFLDPRLRGV